MPLISNVRPLEEEGNQNQVYERHDERVVTSKASSDLGSVGDGINAGHFVVVNHVHLYPWSNLVSPQLEGALAAVVPFAVYMLAFASGARWLMLIGVVHSYIWLMLQVRQWWISYLLGPTPIHKVIPYRLYALAQSSRANPQNRMLP
jgi:hypothetical protein